MLRRDVDRDADGEALRLPPGALLERRVEDPELERVDQSARLRELDEGLGRDRALRRVVPAAECLDRRAPAAADVDDGLVDDTEAVRRERCAEVGDEPPTIGGPDLQGLIDRKSTRLNS